MDTKFKTWTFSVIEVRPKQYTVTLRTPDGTIATSNRIPGAMNVIFKVTEFLQRHVWMQE